MLRQHKFPLTIVCRGVGERILFGVIAFATHLWIAHRELN